MTTNSQLLDIISKITERRLPEALDDLENYLLTYPRQHDKEQLDALRADYSLLEGYWRRGFDDPQRPALYDQLLRRLYVLTQNVVTTRMLVDSPFMKALHVRPRQQRHVWSMSSVKNDVEEFTADVAMLQLEEPALRQQKSQELYQRHQDQMRDLFDYILTSRQWRDTLADDFRDLLLSPTLYTIDQQLIVSAITLSALQVFCPQKFRVLTEVYQKATDEAVRQTALVGWVMCADAGASALFTEMRQQVDTLLQDERTRQELLELQMQMVYCLNADADTSTIRNEILPDIIKGSNIKVTDRGVVEMDEDSLDDILHPEESERNIENMEKSVGRMADMQRQGADIYFGGFSQMKRFPFFNEVSNWLMPFYPQHPAVSAIWNQKRGKRFLKTITRLGAFCDSDKYSFVLAFNQVLDHLPQNILKMVDDGDATPLPIGGEVDTEEQAKPAFIRRMYLQNLYRFYRLFNSRREFADPFQRADSTIFLASGLFASPLLAHERMSAARFLMKKHRHGDAARVLQRIDEQQRGLSGWLMLGTALLRSNAADAHATAEDCFRHALSIDESNPRALASLARLLFDSRRYQEAMSLYDRLLTIEPDKPLYQLNAAVCMLHTGQADEALKQLYRLNYEDEGNMNVRRTLAWALTVTGKYLQARKHYEMLTGTDDADSVLPSDLLNYGLCLWLERDIAHAIAMLHRYVGARRQADDGFSVSDGIFAPDEQELLRSRGITAEEQQMMLHELRKENTSS